MSNKSEPGHHRVKDRIPYGGKGVDELIGALRKILADNPYTQKIVLEVGEPYIYIEKVVKDGEALPPELSIHDVIRTNEMEEYEDDGSRTPTQQLWEMFGMVHEKGLQVSRIVVGNKTKFQKWLGVRIHSTRPTVFGTSLQVLGEIPEDSFIICASKEREGEVEDIRYSLKGNL